MTERELASQVKQREASILSLEQELNMLRLRTFPMLSKTS